ncbi:MAG: 16S rRNA (cytosine(1402)-N(4))-methyltransferase RsmH [Thermomicrobiales bacterium]|nr:16S rRNA (cytosine(1402)-N(4))-methyltransferase RsmH [Thermomicrobiales bacterium]
MSETAVQHLPVLLNEAVDALAPRDGGRYIDGTFGGGGHTRSILDRSAPGGQVLAFDRDPEAIERARQLSQTPSYQDRLAFVHASFGELRTIAPSFGFAPADGILLDLGLSSFQLDAPGRGFAFGLDGPLDMRFDTSTGPSAADLVNTLDEEEIARIIWQFGEDRNSRRIAAAIMRARSSAPIETTPRLASIVEQAVGGRRGAPTHPATRTFQALRIAVNEELETLASVLPDAVATLAPGGRLVVIAFHSLEDRIVKQFLKRESTQCLCPPEQPVCTCRHEASLALVGKAIKSGHDEIARNPRSRSAIMRVATRLPASVSTAA